MPDIANKPHSWPSDVTIEKLVYGGAGLARDRGHVVLVPFTLPGDHVEIHVERAKAGLLEARPTSWLERGPGHAEAPCPHYSVCGGCHYQHTPYENQIASKVEILREVFRRVGKFEAPEQIATVAGEPWHYRNRTQFHFDRDRVGFHEMRTNRLTPVESCPISAPAINEALRVIRESMADRRWPRFLKSLELFTNGEQVLLNVRETEGDRGISRGFFEWMAERITGAQDGSLAYPVGAQRLHVSHGSFFQVNRFLIEQLIETALGGAEGEAALDLYAGVGLFSLPLAGRFGHVTAVETDGAAVRDLEVNAGNAGRAVEVHRMQAEQYLEQCEKAPSFVLADPPRSGLGKHVVRHLLRLEPREIVLVSCDPSTLARDAAALVGAGYSIESLHLVDLFPQTYHIESITRLIKH